MIPPLESHSTDAAPRACWSCKGPAERAALFCPTCGAVQPPAALDAFDRLEVAPGFALDTTDLDRRYFALQRRLHPDRFVTRGGRERALSQQQAAAINDAYEALKDPVARGVALLRRTGRVVDIDGQGTVADPELLMEALEMREALADAPDAASVSALVAKAEADVAASRADVAAAFTAGDLDTAERALLRLRYLDRLSDEARARRRRGVAA